MLTGISISLSPSDRARLAAIAADRNSPQKHVWRAQIVLLSADGVRIPTKAATYSNFEAATIPISKRPGCHRLVGQFWSSHSGASRVKRERAVCLKSARHLSLLVAAIFCLRTLVASVTPRWLDVRKFR